MMYNPNNSIPPIIKNLLIINGLMFLLSSTLESRGIDLNQIFGLFFYKSEYFRIWQPITHLFMHANFTHLLTNMFSLWMFGRILEGVWGEKRFLVYYFVTGLGAALLHTIVNAFSISSMLSALQAFHNTPSPESFEAFVKTAPHIKQFVYDYINQWYENPSDSTYIAEATRMADSVARQIINIPTVGASGAVFGILLAFGMMFPEAKLMLLFPPIPIKAKWFVLGYGALELYLGLTQPGSNIAHFAHLGGMLFGYFLIRHWRRNQFRIY